MPAVRVVTVPGPGTLLPGRQLLNIDYTHPKAKTLINRIRITTRCFYVNIC